MLRLSILLAVGVLALVGCGGGDDESSTQAATTQAQTKAPATTTEAAVPPASKVCDTPVSAVCSIGQNTFGAGLILAQTGGQGTGLQVSYAFSAEPDKATIEAKMSAAYEAVFDQLGDQFKYVDIAAYPPGSTIDAVGVKYPTYNTSIGVNEVQSGADPSSYWRVESIDPSL
jgi:hypothetical protein